MSTRIALRDRLQSSGIEPEDFTDRKAAVPACLLRYEANGELVVGVGDDLDLKDAVGALVDGLALAQLRELPQLRLQLGASANDPSRLDGLCYAMRNLIGPYDGPIRIALEAEASDGTFSEVDTSEAGGGFQGIGRVTNWATRLGRLYAAEPDDLGVELIDRASIDGLRLYPSISSKGWSLRLDGLAVGKVEGSHGWLKVGTEVSAKDPVKSWLEVRGGDFAKLPFSADSIGVAVETLRRFEAKFRRLPCGVLNHGQPEHSLEAAILRGRVGVQAEGRDLRAPVPEKATDRHVAWGSQFPTLWWPRGRSRYLDALLRDGSTPWAVEMKVAQGSGYGRYQRQAITQAVLYRHFIRTAPGLQPWFDALGLSRESCKAAVLLPEPSKPTPPAVESRLEDLRHLAADFDVQLLRTPVDGLY